MIILSNCLTGILDEGSLKIANNLIKWIKKSAPETLIVSYDRQLPLSDRHLPLNKWLLSCDLIQLLRQKKEPVLYIPFPARMLPTALRIFILSRFAHWGLRTMIVMQGAMNKPARWLIKASKAEILTVSRPTWEIYRELLGDRAVYLKTGVNTERFSPVGDLQKKALRSKYNLPQDKPIVLHVGHMNAGRNIGHLLNLDEKWHVLLVVSTLAPEAQNENLRRRFKEKENVTLIDCYMPNIEELYQLADVYFFPVLDASHCIDVPLSALEAAACGIPVATTHFGEMQELIGKTGFYAIESFEPAILDGLLQKAVTEKKNPRPSVLTYDWNVAVNKLLLQNTVWHTHRTLEQEES